MRWEDRSSGSSVALTGKTYPLVEALARCVGRLAHVPLADECCLISRTLEIGRKLGQPGLGRVMGIDHTMVSCGHAGQDCRAARLALAKPCGQADNRYGQQSICLAAPSHDIAQRHIAFPAAPA